MRRIVTLVALLGGIAPAALAIKLPLLDWADVGNEEFRAAVDKLAGKESIDCGLVLMAGKQPDGAGRRKALACMADAQSRKVAFKFGTSRVPLDSHVTEVYVRTSSGETWQLVFDLMPLENVYQTWIAACDSVEVDPTTLYLSGENCEERTP